MCKQYYSYILIVATYISSYLYGCVAVCTAIANGKVRWCLLIMLLATTIILSALTNDVHFPVVGLGEGVLRVLKHSSIMQPQGIQKATCSEIYRNPLNTLILALIVILHFTKCNNFMPSKRVVPTMTSASFINALY